MEIKQIKFKSKVDVWPEEYDAWQVGDLAVYWCNSWHVVHIPTTCTIDSVIPFRKMSKDEIINWCIKVQSEYQSSWQTIAKLNHMNWNDHDIETCNAINRLRAWCLSVKE